MKFNHLVGRVKDFVKRNRILYEIIYTMIFFVWSIERVIRAKLIFRKIKPALAKKNNFKVIIPALRTIPFTNLIYFETVFGHGFKKLGCDVKMLYCDGVLDSCDADIVFRNQRPQCSICKRFNNSLKNSLGLDAISYRQYISNSDIEEIKEKVAKLDDKGLSNYEYLGVNVGEHAQTSVIRYFLFGRLDLDDPKQVSMLRKKLVYAMIATKVASQMIQKEKPDCIFMLHGIYSSWGPFLSYARLKGIDTVIYITALSTKTGYCFFDRNGEGSPLISKKEWSNLMRLPLKNEEERQINNYFAKRFKGEAGDQEMYESNFDIKIKKQSILEALSKKKYSRRYIMYPNVVWDVALKGSVSEIFDDVFSWIDASIEFFKNKKDYQLIIKPHPAELVRDRCNKGIRDYIIEKYSSLPENITILDPNVPLRAHDLITPDTICLVFNGTLGMEFAASGTPVLVVADIDYRDAGVVYKIDTLEEYLKLLENPSELIQFAKDNIELAKKYAYFYFLKSTIRIPFYRKDRWAVIDWKSMANTEKLLDESSNIIKVCKKIINREDIVL